MLIFEIWKNFNFWTYTKNKTYALSITKKKMQDRLRKVYNILQFTISTTAFCNKISEIASIIFSIFQVGMGDMHSSKPALFERNRTERVYCHPKLRSHKASIESAFGTSHRFLVSFLKCKTILILFYLILLVSLSLFLS